MIFWPPKKKRQSSDNNFEICIAVDVIIAPKESKENVQDNKPPHVVFLVPKFCHLLCNICNKVKNQRVHFPICNSHYWLCEWRDSRKLSEQGSLIIGFETRGFCQPICSVFPLWGCDWFRNTSTKMSWMFTSEEEEDLLRKHVSWFHAWLKI